MTICLMRVSSVSMLNAISPILIDEHEIHVWFIYPKEFNNFGLLDSFKNLLSTDESEKIARYRLDSAKQSALITRVFVRLVLSQYQQCLPKNLSFTYSELGKPELKNNARNLRFNLSHNSDLIVCAVCLNSNIGCDVESLSRKMSILPIAKRFFSKEEFTDINSLPDSLQRKGFFERWTLKESYVKATGKGISQGLDTFRFKLKTSDSRDYTNDIELFIDREMTSSSEWFNALLYPDEKHCIALSVNSTPQQRVIVKENASSLFNEYLKDLIE